MDRRHSRWIACQCPYVGCREGRKRDSHRQALNCVRVNYYHSNTERSWDGQEAIIFAFFFFFFFFFFEKAMGRELSDAKKIGGKAHLQICTIWSMSYFNKGFNPKRQPFAYPLLSQPVFFHHSPPPPFPASWKMTYFLNLRVQLSSIIWIYVHWLVTDRWYQLPMMDGLAETLTALALGRATV